MIIDIYKVLSSCMLMIKFCSVLYSNHWHDVTWVSTKTLLLYFFTRRRYFLPLQLHLLDVEYRCHRFQPLRLYLSLVEVPRHLQSTHSAGHAPRDLDHVFPHRPAQYTRVGRPPLRLEDHDLHWRYGSRVFLHHLLHRARVRSTTPGHLLQLHPYLPPRL